MRFFAVLFFVLIPGLVSADDASHRAAAGKLIEVVNTRDTMRNAFISSVDALASAAPGGKLPPEELAEMKDATKFWFNEELNWTELNSELEDAFVKAFTEDELNQLTAFYQTPLGQKTLTQLPVIMRQAMAIGQKFAVSKQALWKARLEKIDEKYRSASTPAATSTGAGTPSPAGTSAK